jgi:hypothetical protein
MTAGAETIRPDGAKPYLAADPDYCNSSRLSKEFMQENIAPIFHCFRIMGILYPSETPTARRVP